MKNKNVTSDIEVDTNSNLPVTITVYEPAPGLKTIFSFIVPDQKSGKITCPFCWKVELQYLNEYAGINTSIGLSANPIVNFSGVLGNNVLSVGAGISFDTPISNFTRINAGLNLAHVDLIAVLALNEGYSEDEGYSEECEGWVGSSPKDLENGSVTQHERLFDNKSNNVVGLGRVEHFLRSYGGIDFTFQVVF